ncbi:myogenesis-regulating glycosidase-like [Schistocerca gregaria]|uniref:myogenesis-regulating glycosidase-like n=1 Tax=Schistocerca gregaria TaxID=7010 RepID=UPI00211DB531|nr:myogenesis-regulating glycosidase-like [Schistocerca gregaria]
MARAIWATPTLLLLGVFLVASTAAEAGISTRYDEATGRILLLTHRGGREVEVGYVAVGSGGRPRSRPRHEAGPDGESFHFGDSEVVFRHDRTARCVTAHQWINSSTTAISVCQRHLGSHLYGGMESTSQRWPIEDVELSDFAYVPQQIAHAGIVVRYWLFSDGRLVHIHSNVPLFIDQNTNQTLDKICFTAENKAPYPVERQGNVMDWDLCSFDDAKQAHVYALQNYLGKPTGIPDERMATHPQWSTYGRFRTDINDTAIRQFASEIVDNGFQNSHIEISDKWESCYGNLTFDTTAFPDPKALVDDLHAMGFRVLLWVHPFINRGCEPLYSEALANGYFVANTEGDTLTRWWRGVAGIIDITNPDAVAWWTNRILALQNATGIDAFRFAAGETSFLPQLPALEPIERNPVVFTDEYARIASQFGPMTELEASVESQHLPNFFSMDGVDSMWSTRNGLETLLPKLLEISMVGHPFVMPEKIGGSTNHDVYPTYDLFIRWLQATVFMPSLGYSIAPWDFDTDTLNLSRNLTELHAQYAPRIVELMQKAVEDGTPVNLPVWWLDPTDQTALTINDEYLLGEDLLVAPVVRQWVDSRDIYLPVGQWRDEVDPEHPIYRGPRWLYSYSAPLYSLPPYFSRVAAA